MTPSLKRCFPLVAALLAAVLATGCATEAPPVPVAHLAIENLTSYAWRIALTPRNGGTPQILAVDPHDSPTLDVPAGAYQVDQRIATLAARGAVPRDFTAELKAGETYRWPLMTLLSP